MEAKTLIQLLNYSKTLIQNGELTYLVYEKPMHPDEVGVAHRNMLAEWEKQLREEPPKSKNPEAIRKKILGYLEEEKRYGGFRENMLFFAEANLVFQVLPEKQASLLRYAYRLRNIYLFEDYPSLEHHRFLGAGSQRYYFSNGSENLEWIPPSQLSNHDGIGLLARYDDIYHPIQLYRVEYLPLPNLSDATSYQVHLSETDTGETVYVITYFPYEKVKEIAYVRLKNGLPEVFREEFYSQGKSRIADAEGYWLRLVKMYRDFEQVEVLNIAYPKEQEVQEFHGVDGVMRIHTFIVIKEMDFNLKLPANFFDWDKAELIGDDGKHRHIRPAVVVKETTK